MYYTKKLELAEKQVWKKDSMTNGEAIFPKRPVKTTGFFLLLSGKKKTCYNTFWQKFSLNFAASVYDIVSGLGNKSIKPEDEESSKIRSALNNNSYISITINWIIRILTNCTECFSSFLASLIVPKKYPKIWLNS